MKEFVKGLEGVVVAETSLSHVDGKKGKLVYRGYSIEDLAKYSSFEEVVYLLWYDKLPTKKELNKFKNELNKNMSIPGDVKNIISKLPKKTAPMSGLRTCISLLSSYDKDADDNSEEANRRKAIRILAATPVIIAALSRAKDGKEMVNPKKNFSIAGNFLYMMRGKEPSKKEEKIMDLALILHAEHGMNASTFSSRVTVATLSDLHSGIVSAIGTLKGSLHGGANRKALEGLHHFESKFHVKDKCGPECKKAVDRYVEDALQKHILIMGIGHRVYKVKDPRAYILEEYAKNVVHKQDYEIAKEIEKIMAKEKKLYPNVDFFSGIVYEDLGIKPEFYVCIFALSRTAGWIAHMLDQFRDNRLIRPTTIYVGPAKMKYIPLEKR